jgi:hypothetical protein
MFDPEDTVMVPGDVKRATTNTESDSWFHPSGRPPVVVSVASQLMDFGVGRYQ